MKSVEDLANSAVAKVREIMSQSCASEIDTLKEFSDRFDSEVEGWDMRIGELESEDNED